jgi:hypothetical protein
MIIPRKLSPIKIYEALEFFVQQSEDERAFHAKREDLQFAEPGKTIIKYINDSQV